MANTKTNTAPKTAIDRKTDAKASTGKLILNVTSEEQFIGLYKTFQDGFNAALKGDRDAKKVISDRARERLWIDLGAALDAAEVLRDIKHVEWLEAALREHGIPVVEDADTANEFLPLVRLLMGYWPKPAKNAKPADPKPTFKWSESCWLYARVLRNASELKLSGKALTEKLFVDKGLNKIKKADAKSHDAKDAELIEQEYQYKEVINMPPYAIIPSEGLGIPAKDRPELVAVICLVSPDGKQLNVVERMDTSVDVLRRQVYKLNKSATYRAQLEKRKAELEAAEARAENEVLRRQLAIAKGSDRPQKAA